MTMLPDGPGHAGRAADRILAGALEAVAYGADPVAVAEAAKLAAGALGARLHVRIRTDRLSVDGTLEKAELVRIALVGRRSDWPFRSVRTTIVGYDTLPIQLRLGHVVLGALSTAQAGLTAGKALEEVSRIATARLAEAADSTTDSGRVSYRVRLKRLWPPPSLRVAGGIQFGSNEPFDADSNTSGGAMVPPPVRTADGQGGSASARHERDIAKPVRLGDVIYLEVTMTAERPVGSGRDTMVLGDMLRVTAAEPEPLTRMARRLWL